MDTTYFSIIALRILPGCKEHIRKCLKTNVFYYFNTNYEISDQGDTIKIREGFVKAVGENFFDLHDGKSSPCISISAIVGKNGDGKSSIIEVIIRLINNFAHDKGLNPHDHLVYISGVCAELYYKLDDEFFRIRVSTVEKNQESVLMFRYIRDKSHNLFTIDRKILPQRKIRESSFYTLVSNYSHFAYNTEEFLAETTSDGVSEHWLDKVFHKNDAYQTPINLHPYRNCGNIDINRERQLSTQRLLITIANSISKNESTFSETAADINDKIPYKLEIEDIGYSKLQNYTLRKYFEDNKNSNILGTQIEIIKESVLRPGNMDNGEGLIGDLAGTSLSNLSKYYIRKPLMRFLKSAISWLEKHQLLCKNSDLAQLVENLHKLNDDVGLYISNKNLKVWKELNQLSAIQFLRLALVYDICRLWNSVGVGIKKSMRLSFDPTLIFKSYESLSTAEKCFHYIIYKTIEIFMTYPSYGNPIRGYASSEVFFSFRVSDSSLNTLFNLKDAFYRLATDWHIKSHITLKLRQTYSLLRGYNASRKLYASVSKYKGKSLVFESLSEKYIRTLSNIESLPPPIFKWEIIYRRRDEKSPIAFSTFSSGEKQKMFFQSAIIYHLRNINSIGDEKIHYHSVNLIFEEIELYFHPEWQRSLIFDLMRSIRNANIQNIVSINMIFVTHSPYILSDIPKSNVLFLKDGMPVYEMQENTFGANINSLLKNGFFLPSLPMGEFAYRKINTLFEKLHSGQFDPHTIPQLYAQIMTVGEPAIRTQLITLLAPYKRLFQ